MSLQDLPAEMRLRVRSDTDPEGGRQSVKLALNQTMEFLRARDPKDPLVAAYAGQSREQGCLRGPGWLDMRNNSILAHGFASVTKRNFDAARDWVEANLLRFFESSLFPQLPHTIPYP